MHIIKKHVEGGAGVSIAELWENCKTTTLRLPNDLAFYIGPFMCAVCASVQEEKEPGIHCFAHVPI